MRETKEFLKARIEKLEKLLQEKNAAEHNAKVDESIQIQNLKTEIDKLRVELGHVYEQCDMFKYEKERDAAFRRKLEKTNDALAARLHGMGEAIKIFASAVKQ